MLVLLALLPAFAVADECQCPMGRRLLINPDTLTCKCWDEQFGNGRKYALTPEGNYIKCGDTWKECKGPDYTCIIPGWPTTPLKPTLKGELCAAPPEKTEVGDCRCPMGRRLIINPDLYTCGCWTEQFGREYKLVPKKNYITCPSTGMYKECSGPDYVCVALDINGVANLPLEPTLKGELCGAEEPKAVRAVALSQPEAARKEKKQEMRKEKKKEKCQCPIGKIDPDLFSCACYTAQYKKPFTLMPKKSWLPCGDDTMECDAPGYVCSGPDPALPPLEPLIKGEFCAAEGAKKAVAKKKDDCRCPNNMINPNLFSCGGYTAHYGVKYKLVQKKVWIPCNGDSMECGYPGYVCVGPNPTLPPLEPCIVGMMCGAEKTKASRAVAVVARKEKKCRCPLGKVNPDLYTCGCYDAQYDQTFKLTQLKNWIECGGESIECDAPGQYVCVGPNPDLPPLQPLLKGYFCDSKRMMVGPVSAPAAAVGLLVLAAAAAVVAVVKLTNSRKYKALAVDESKALVAA